MPNAVGAQALGSVKVDNLDLRVVSGILGKYHMLSSLSLDKERDELNNRSSFL